MRRRVMGGGKIDYDKYPNGGVYPAREWKVIYPCGVERRLE